jgi:hypothetical protein
MITKASFWFAFVAGWALYVALIAAAGTLYANGFLP